MKTAFLTGGSGFVGRNMIRRLRAEGVAVRALARSEASANSVAALGAVPVRGDLFDHDSLCSGMRGCDAVFHAAAHVEEWGAVAAFERVNVEGTRGALDAARTAGVPVFVHVGTEAVYADGRSSLEGLTEDRALPDKPLPGYPSTKAAAERLVLAANSPALRTVVVRPRLIWGNDDTSVLDKLAAAVTSGRFAWIDGGRARTSTTHVDNVCEGLWRGALHGRGGEAYFVSDGDPTTVREFVSALLATRGIAAPRRSLPRGVVRAIALLAEPIWTLLGLTSPPPATRMVVALMGGPVTIVDDKARRDIGYRPVISREQGLAQLGGGH